MELASQEEAGARAFAGLYGRRDAPILSILITTSVMTLARAASAVSLGATSVKTAHVAA